VRVCPQTVWPLAKEPAEELRLAGMLIEAARGQVDWMAYPDQAAQEVKALIEAKLAGQTGATPVPAPTILPLLEALKQSVGAQNEKETAPSVPAKASRKRARRTA
jgi:non-homologous end joining protein Ku